MQIYKLSSTVWKFRTDNTALCRSSVGYAFIAYMYAGTTQCTCCIRDWNNDSVHKERTAGCIEAVASVCTIAFSVCSLRLPEDVYKRQMWGID